MNIVDFLLGRLTGGGGSGADAGLPVLANPASASEIFAGKESYSAAGKRMIGNFTITPELEEQAALIAQLENAVLGKHGQAGVVIYQSGTNLTIR